MGHVIWSAAACSSFRCAAQRAGTCSQRRHSAHWMVAAAPAQRQPPGLYSLHRRP